MPYTSTTWAELQARLQDRLDSKAVFYTNNPGDLYPEVPTYLKEALRFWNCASQKHRERFTFTTQPGKAFYNLHDPADLNNLVPGNLVAHTVTVRDLIGEMQLQLMEPVSPVVWTGTDMFTMEQVVNALQKRRDQFLVETGVEQVFEAAGTTDIGGGRIDFIEGLLDIRRLDWLTLDGLRHHVWRSDEWASDSLNINWPITPAPIPLQFSILLTNPLRIQLLPPPSLPGQIERVSTQTGVALDPGANTLVGVPDDWAWAIKYGAMADLLGQENQARDPQRAAYCESRYQMGVELCSRSPIVLRATINARPTPLVSVEELDTQKPGWNNAAGIPTVIAVSEYMLAMSPVPDAEYGVSLDVLRTAPIPVLDVDTVQIGPEEIDAVVDYAHHIGTFKEGGAEFGATQRNFKNLIQQAQVFNERLSAMAFWKEIVEVRSKRESQRRERREQLEPIVSVE